jgi:hypothetical protein
MSKQQAFSDSKELYRLDYTQLFVNAEDDPMNASLPPDLNNTLFRLKKLDEAAELKI